MRTKIKVINTTGNKIIAQNILKNRLFFFSINEYKTAEYLRCKINKKTESLLTPGKSY